MSRASRPKESDHLYSMAAKKLFPFTDGQSLPSSSSAIPTFTGLLELLKAFVVSFQISRASLISLKCPGWFARSRSPSSAARPCHRISSGDHLLAAPPLNRSVKHAESRTHPHSILVAPKCCLRQSPASSCAQSNCLTRSCPRGRRPGNRPHLSVKWLEYVSV
jgi:hypothetical protein